VSHAILVIEDEAVLAKNIHIYLERYGYEVSLAQSAEEGLALLDSVRPDAVLLDFNLPGIKGIEALGRIREFDPGIQVLMLTGHGNVEMAVDAMKAGAFDFLTKPVALSKLRLLLDKAMGETRRDNALSYYRQRDARTLTIATHAGFEADARATAAGRGPDARCRRPRGAGAGRNRHRQGSGRACAALQRPSPRQALRRAELRGTAGAAARIGVVRPRARRLYRCA
jgi:FixJ family two-component response regulator